MSLIDTHALPFTTRRQSHGLRAVVTQRHVTLAAPDEVLICPDGHRYADVWVWEYGVMPCRHKESDGGAQCQWAAYLIGGGLKDMTQKPRVLVLHVTIQEALTMRRERMDFDRSLRFLGLLGERRTA